MIKKIVYPEGEKRKSPNQYVALQLTLANVFNGVNIEEVYSFIESNLDDVDTYYINPEPGHCVAAALDYTMLLSLAADFASLASLLWIAYDKFIGSRKSSPKDDAGIYIGIPFPNGKIMPFWIGNDYKDKDIFIETFVECIEELKQNPDSFRVAINIKSEMEHSKIWAKRK